MAERKKAGSLSDFQMEIMNIVWDLGDVTVADVIEQFEAKRPIARSTAQTMLMRLEERGWLKHDQEGNTFRYSPARDRSNTLKEMVSRMVDTSFKGSAEGLVLALIDGRGISDEEAGRIAKLIDDSLEEQK